MKKLTEKLIKIGHEDPELRSHLRPILSHLEKEASMEVQSNQRLENIRMENLAEEMRRSIQGVDFRSLHGTIFLGYDTSEGFHVAGSLLLNKSDGMYQLYIQLDPKEDSSSVKALWHDRLTYEPVHPKQQPSDWNKNMVNQVKAQLKRALREAKRFS